MVFLAITSACIASQCRSSRRRLSVSTNCQISKLLRLDDNGMKILNKKKERQEMREREGEGEISNQFLFVFSSFLSAR